MNRGTQEESVLWIKRRIIIEKVLLASSWNFSLRCENMKFSEFFEINPTGKGRKHDAFKSLTESNNLKLHVCTLKL